MNRRKLILSLNIMLMMFILGLSVSIDKGELFLPTFLLFVSSLTALLFRVKTTMNTAVLAIAFFFLFCYGWWLAVEPTSEILRWASVFLGSFLGILLGGLFQVPGSAEGDSTA